MKKIRIAIVTGSRAEYSLLRPLIKLIEKDKECAFKLIVTASHLSEEYGYTKNEIVKDKLKIYQELEILSSSNNSIGMSKSVGLGFLSFSDCLSKLKPDLLIILGDRYEIFVAAYTSILLNIPVAHIHGGELTYGAIDDILRHAITKASSFHFTSTSTYRKRVIQMGENPKNVFNYGALAVERLKKSNNINFKKLEEFKNFDFSSGYILVTVHPETAYGGNSGKIIDPILDSLDQLKDFSIIMTYSNSDPGGNYINNKKNKFCQINPYKRLIIKSMGYDLYANILKNSKLILGNSSSGIFEAPILGIPNVNVGTRQEGRITSNTNYNAKPKEKDITNIINKIIKMKKMKPIKHGFGKGNTSQLILNEIKNIFKKGNIVSNKKFYDIKFKI
ncbi:MAG: UDP-N-acetylglucosamine 2-epimerase (hydrolyzing) [Rickettsiales bacterium TMED251]|nr:MAG: UDP-N-acetylglucosamine 2-epimerase (hydrolyzing) [Rickettsiales bacterium TMED251]|tara:strand:- start:1877 stop:3046 length:1170 start_codon:yes stop_codon:yes gene_type:complete